MRAANEEWAAEHGLQPDPYEGMDAGEYTSIDYPAPPSPTSWYPPQPPMTRHGPNPNRFRPQHPQSRYQRGPPRAPRQRYEYRPPRTPRTRRTRYRPPQKTIGDVYGERGPPPPPNHANRDQTKVPLVPQHSRRLPNTSIETDRRHSKPLGSWRERPPHPHPPRHIRSRSDSLDWREARPGRPISFKTPSPSPTDPGTVLPPPRTPPKPVSAPQENFKLSSLIEQAATALKQIIFISRKLISRVNAERRIAHKISSTVGQCSLDTPQRNRPGRTFLERGPPVTGCHTMSPSSLVSSHT
jgi:hypothetical protein